MAFSVNNRRYTGCKAKLTDWIRRTILRNCNDCNSFCDIFAGTSVVTERMINDYSEFYINDFLYSNEMIYKAFYLKSDYSEEKIYKYAAKYNSYIPDNLEDNYFNVNFGDKFFSNNDAKLIGEIREDIEKNKDCFNEKEFAILLVSLLYSADRSANTCGHYDAYIKKQNLRSSFKYELVDPVIKSTNDKRIMHISRQDANVLAKNIKSDIVYMDPPYSSRQYSRFYHVLENITKWEKPELFGTALKPAEENMSEYCKSKALDSFKDLVYSLDCKYIIVSYNNTYNSKSSSSKNKMTLDEIKEVLDKKGKTKVISQKHKAFNAGSTEFSDHREYLFITKVGEFND